MDNVLIIRKDEKSHLEHLEIVRSRLREHGLYVSPKKCEFMKTEMAFLGFIVGEKGLRVNLEKVKVLKTWPKSDILTDLRSFLGLSQFCRRFISGFSEIAAPLTNLTKKDKGIDKWDDKCAQAFASLKEAIIRAPILVSPDWKKPFRGHVDASRLAAGVKLTQLDENGRDRVIAFYSKKLSPAEAHYYANDRELLGMISFLGRFQCYLEGSTFEIFTDNQVLKHFLTKPKLNRKEPRRLETIGNFDIFPITLKPGKIHVLGDALSRAPQIVNCETKINDVEVPSIDVNGVLSDYEGDQFFGPVVRAHEGEWPEDDTQRRTVEKILLMFKRDGSKLMYHGNLCVPRKSVSNVLQFAHDSKICGHFGFSKTLSRFDGYRKKHNSRDVKNYVRRCSRCQQYKDSRQKKLTEPSSLEMPERRWGSFATDFIVSLPMSKRGFDSIIKWVDWLTRRVHFIPSLATDTAVNAAESFFRKVFKHYGIPDSIVSDRDPKFMSNF